jgi:hypothetical protein
VQAIYITKDAIEIKINPIGDIIDCIKNSCKKSIKFIKTFSVD